MARKRSKAITVYRKHSVQPKKWKKKSWVTHPAKEMIPLPQMSQAISLGNTTDETIMSMMESWQRNQYIGLCNWGSSVITKKVKPFPVRDNIYMRRKKMSNINFKSLGYRNPRSSKFLSDVTFSHSIEAGPDLPS